MTIKYNFERQRNDYQTPPDIVDYILSCYLGGIECFDLDVCCSKTNIPAKNHFIDGVDDGLMREWSAINFCNPPYDECDKWIKKGFEEQLKGNTTAFVIPSRTETGYWHKYILDGGRTWRQGVDGEFLKKGTQFIHPDTNEPCGVFKNGLAIVVFNGYKEGLRIRQLRIGDDYGQ